MPLIQKYNIPSPRYTSYPTVLFWNKKEFNTDDWIKSFQKSFSESNQSESESSEDTDDEQSINEATTESDEADGSGEENREAALSEASSDEAENSADEQASTTVIEGMSLSDAQLLLDSLRDNERILPYTEPSEAQGRKGEVRDW